MDKRSPNFTSSEVGFLLSAVKKWRHIIECKKTDNVSSQEKLNAWKNVESEYNSKYSHTFHSLKVLKTKYENLKSTSKQIFAADKRAAYGTGGGSLKQKTATKMYHTILEICQGGQLLGNVSNFDSDADIDCKYLYNEYGADDSIYCIGEDKDDKLETGAEEVVLQPNISCDKSWQKYTPKMLKRPLDRSLKAKRETTKDTWAKVAEVKLKKKHSRNTEKHEFLKETHELEMTKLRLDIELRKTQIRNAKKIVKAKRSLHKQQYSPLS